MPKGMDKHLKAYASQRAGNSSSKLVSGATIPSSVFQSINGLILLDPDAPSTNCLMISSSETCFSNLSTSEAGHSTKTATCFG